MKTSVLIPLANGSEEMEAVILVDTLRRAGWRVVTASVDDSVVVCSRDVKLVADSLWDEVEVGEFDMIVVPGGGPGTQRLLQHGPLLAALRQFHEANKMVAAVCAGPLVLQEAGVLGQAEVTSHPSVENQLTGVSYRTDLPVVVHGNCVTSRGPGTCFDFALTLVAIRDGGERAEELRVAMCLGATAT